MKNLNPIMAHHYSFNCIKMNLVFYGEGSIAIFTCFKLLSDFFCNLASKFVVFSTFLKLINHVVFIRPKKKMLRVNTVPNITPMTNFQTIWNFTKRNLIRKTMAHIQPAVVRNPPISFMVDAALPKQTIARWGSVVKKTVNQFVANYKRLISCLLSFFAFTGFARRIESVASVFIPVIESHRFSFSTFGTSFCKNRFSHSVFSTIENGLIRLARDVQNLWRAVSILPQNHPYCALPNSTLPEMFRKTVMPELTEE